MKRKQEKRAGKMKMLKAMVIGGLISLFFLSSSVTFAKSYLRKMYYEKNEKMPSGVPSGAESWLKLDTTMGSNDRYIGYKGVSLIIDPRVELGGVIYTENGVFIYDKEGNLIACIFDTGIGYALLEETFVIFDQGSIVTLGGDKQGKINKIKVGTQTGIFTVEKTQSGDIEVTSPVGNIYSYNSQDYDFNWITIHNEGTACIWLWSLEQGTLTRIKFDAEGKISLENTRKFSIQTGENIHLSLTVDKEGSVIMGSNIEDSVKLKFKRDGSIEVIKPDGTVIPVARSIKVATFNEDGSLTIKFLDNVEVTIDFDTEEPWLEK